MDVIEQMQARRSIRRYRPDPIPDATLARVLKAGMRAATSGNMQTYSVVVTKKERRRRSLWELHYQQAMILQAPVVLTFCADWSRMTSWSIARGAAPGYDNFQCFMISAGDTFLAAQSVATAAESAGLGVCFMGTTLRCSAGLIDLLGLPRLVFPLTSLVMGFADEDPAPRARLPMTGMLHAERYEPFDEERIDAVYRERDKEGWERYMSMPEMADRIREAGLTNLAQVYAQLKHPQKQSEARSAALLEVIRRQGFATDGASGLESSHA